MPNNAPIVDGFIQNDDQTPTVHVWCRWCCTWHTHGLADSKPGDHTHRVAHCYAPDSAYEDAGYTIRITDTPYSTARRSVREASSVQRSAIRDGRISEAVQRLRDQPAPAA